MAAIEGFLSPLSLYQTVSNCIKLYAIVADYFFRLLLYVDVCRQICLYKHLYGIESETFAQWLSDKKFIRDETYYKNIYNNLNETLGFVQTTTFGAYQT